MDDLHKSRGRNALNLALMVLLICALMLAATTAFIYGSLPF